MKTIAPNRAARRSAAFTLLELLIVITIIAVLAGMGFAGYSAVMKNVQKTQAKNEIANITLAIKSYYAEYNKYPLENQGSDEEQLRTDQQLMAILMGEDEQMNPRGIVFYEGREARGNPPIGGIVAQGGTVGPLVDPWGEEYNLAIDGDYDNKLQNPDPESTSREIAQGVLVWSTGPDRDLESETGQSPWKDNVASWK